MNTILHSLKTKMSLVFVLMSIISFSQQGINYQGVARDASDELLISQNINLDINILKGDAQNLLYTETHTTTTDINGVFSIVIGEGVAAAIPFYLINWAEDDHYLNVWLNGIEVGTTQFQATPYALAIGKWQAQNNGLRPLGTGGSIFIGDNAGENDDLNNNNNIAIGQNALRNNTTGYWNAAIGFEALTSNTIGISNIALGFQTLYNNTTGFGNTALGNFALESNTDGYRNVALGYSTLSKNTVGNENVAIGDTALRANTTGSNNTAIGNTALTTNTTGSLNTAIGDTALRANTTGNSNVAVGYRSLFSNTTGNNNVANGYRALNANTTGRNNVANGYQALDANTTGNDNVANGYRAMFSNTTGDANIALGTMALGSNVLGKWNTAIGNRALINNSVGLHNVAIGNDALFENITGEDNTAIGSRAGNNNLGSYNVFLGRSSGFNETGNSKLYISNSSTNFPLIYGEFDNNILGFNANVGIGTQAPVVPLQVRGGTDVTLDLNSGQLVLGNHADRNLALDNNEIQARNNGSVSTLYLQGLGGDVNVGGAVVHASDRRLKKDIEDLSFGLEEILKLQPKEYNWKERTQNHKSLGLIAQDVDKVIKNVVTYDVKIDRYGVSYTELIPVLIKAIQEQNRIIKAQSKRNNKQSKTISDLDERLQILEASLSVSN